MPKDAIAESSTANEQLDISDDAAERFYADTTPAESSPAPEEESSSAETEPVEETATDSEPVDDPQEETEVETAQSRDDKGRFQRSNAETRIPELLGEIKQLRQQLSQRTAPPEPKPPQSETKVEELKEPNQNDFETYDAYEKAQREHTQKLIDRQIQDAIAKDRTERQREETERQQQQRTAELKEKLAERRDATAKRIPEFKAKVFDAAGKIRADIPIHPVFDQFIPMSEVGWDVLHHLAVNPKDAQRIAALDDFSASAEFHRIAGDINAKLQKPPDKTTLRPTRMVPNGATRAMPKSAEEVLYGDD